MSYYKYGKMEESDDDDGGYGWERNGGMEEDGHGIRGPERVRDVPFRYDSVEEMEEEETEEESGAGGLDENEILVSLNEDDSDTE